MTKMSWSVQEKYKYICESSQDTSTTPFVIKDVPGTNAKVSDVIQQSQAPANQRFCRDLLPPQLRDVFNSPRMTQSQAIKTQAAMLTKKKWSQHQLLRIKFIGGTPRQRDWVKEIVMKTFKGKHDSTSDDSKPDGAITNLRFEWLPDESSTPSEIRISFDPAGGSWSFLGTDCLQVDPKEPTMNLGWMDYPGSQTESGEFKDGGVIKHEFGHCLGPWIHVSG